MASFLNMPVSALRLREQAAGGAREQAEPAEQPRRWDLATLAGGIAEITTAHPSAGLTAASLLLRDAQEHGEPAAWIAAGDSLPFPLDLAQGGIDLQALPLVRVCGLLDGARACEHLLRSGAFGLVVLDLGRADQGRRTLPAAAQVRLAALCRRHQALLLLLARRRTVPTGSPAVASLALIRAHGSVRRTAFDQFTLDLRIHKDKRGGTGWTREEIFHGPDGLC